MSVGDAMRSKADVGGPARRRPMSDHAGEAKLEQATSYRDGVSSTMYKGMNRSHIANLISTTTL